MAMQKCKECGGEVSSKAKKCPHCGVDNPTVSAKEALTGGLAIVALLAGLGYFFLGGDGSSADPESSVAEEGSAKEKQEEKSYPEKDDSYQQVNSAVGCDSKLSDDKKEDVFNSEYKDHWFTWRGTVVLAETGEASLNLDGAGTQDLQVDFADPETGYDLVKDSTITVKFLMKTAGGCWLPFSGDEAVIVN